MRIVEDLDLTGYNSYGLSARCVRGFFPDTEGEVLEAYRSDAGRRKVLLGSGHNVILAREWFDADFIIFNGNFDRITASGTDLTAEAGAFSADMCRVAQAKGLSGLEMFFDIPSSLGGAVVMNAGAGGEEIGRLVRSVRYLDLPDMEVREVDRSGCQFAYRDSRFQRDLGLVVLGAQLRLKRGDPVQIGARMESIRDGRWAKQPRGLPNAGSVFKRPEGRFVGPMIEELGLKGFSVGGVGISEKHAGFIVRHGPATGHDVLALIQHVKEKVRKAYGVDLEVEQRVIL